MMNIVIMFPKSSDKENENDYSINTDMTQLSLKNKAKGYVTLITDEQTHETWLGR